MPQDPILIAKASTLEFSGFEFGASRRFMGSYKYGYTSPNMGYNYSFRVSSLGLLGGIRLEPWILRGRLGRRPRFGKAALGFRA